MCKRKKNVVVPEENPFDNFELKKPDEAYDANGKRDYFSEYYNTYKNTYIDQYLDAYKKFKAEGKYDDYSPFVPDEKTVSEDSIIKNELDD